MSHTQIPLDSAPTSVREAREATRTWLRNVGRTIAEHPAALIVSELVTNSLTHARGPIVLHLWDQRDCVRIGVSDGSATLAACAGTSPGGASGRGMHLIERFSSSWGSDIDGTGKLTWAEIPAAT